PPPRAGKRSAQVQARGQGVSEDAEAIPLRQLAALLDETHPALRALALAQALGDPLPERVGKVPAAVPGPPGDLREREGGALRPPEIEAQKALRPFLGDGSGQDVVEAAEEGLAAPQPADGPIA